ncbi:MAG: hypothetical protein P8P32_08715 [Akkermansiaceae bacterium]|nr:hypothetical protein [Akkermansiaceae bacterium]
METGTNIIQLEGASTPDVVLNKGEEHLLDLRQGVRDLGIMGMILSHKGRLIATNKRIIYFKKKTKDFEIQQMNIRHSGFVSLGYKLNGIAALVGTLAVLLGGAVILQGEVLMGLLFFLLGVLVLLFSRQRSLVVSGSGGQIIFASKSVNSSELAKVALVVSANS